MKNLNLLKHVFITLLLILLCGCQSIIEAVPIPLYDSQVIRGKAAHRFITTIPTHPSSKPGQVNPLRIICAEPSPDVAEAIATTFGASVNVKGAGGGSLSYGQATALAQLAERTVTVQLLRDQMYRACEAYGNGAISATEYSLLMSRNNDAMVTLMLGEAASRTLGRQLAAVAAAGASSTSGTSSTLVSDAMKTVETQAAAAEENAKLADATSNKAAADIAVQATDEQSSDEAKDNAQDNADAASATVEEREQTAQDANDEAQEQTDLFLRTYANSASRADAAPGGFISGLPSLNGSAVEVAKSLVELQANYFDQSSLDHFVSACIVEHGKNYIKWADDIVSGQAFADASNHLGSVNQVNRFLAREEFREDIEEKFLSSLDDQATKNRGLWGRNKKSRYNDDLMRTISSRYDFDSISLLAQTCIENLPDVLAQDIVQAEALKKEKTKLKTAEFKSRMAQQYLSCSAITDKSERAMCQNTIANIADGTGVTKPIAVQKKANNNKSSIKTKKPQPNTIDRFDPKLSLTVVDAFVLAEQSHRDFSDNALSSFVSLNIPEKKTCPAKPCTSKECANKCETGKKKNKLPECDEQCEKRNTMIDDFVSEQAKLSALHKDLAMEISMKIGTLAKSTVIMMDADYNRQYENWKKATKEAKPPLEPELIKLKIDREREIQIYRDLESKISSLSQRMKNLVTALSQFE